MAKYFGIMFGIISFLSGILGCKAQSGDYRSVEAEEFAECIADTNVVRLDVRTAEEYAAGHIEGAINIDVQQDDFEQRALAELPKGKPIALYCRSGRRSKTAAQILSAKGYEVVELNSGYLGWTSRK